VVASDISAIREFAADAAQYVNPQSIADIKRAMMAIAADPSIRERLRELGLRRALAVRSTPVVDQLLDAYRQAGAVASRRIHG
jgi:glycosyltransferase involved in cell wall biosynthesis